jgi:hypothetical protein
MKNRDLLFLIVGILTGVFPNVFPSTTNINEGIWIELGFVCFLLFIYLVVSIRERFFTSVIRWFDHFYIVRWHYLERIPDNELPILVNYGYSGFDDPRIKKVGGKEILKYGKVKNKVFAGHDFGDLKNQLEAISKSNDLD